MQIKIIDFPPPIYYIRAIVTMTMASADFYAAIIRIILWSRGQLSALQQDMAIKNVMFIMACSGAYDMYDNTITRNWYVFSSSFKHLIAI